MLSHRMIDHVSISVKDLDESLNFYDQTLAILGYERLMTFEELGVAGYGKNEKPDFWIGSKGREDETIGKARGVHVAFLAPNKQAVDKWFDRCLELGGIDNGKPGPRPHYHPGYYGAFIVDPNGWRIEAVFHQCKEQPK